MQFCSILLIYIWFCDPVDLVLIWYVPAFPAPLIFLILVALCSVTVSPMDERRQGHQRKLHKSHQVNHMLEILEESTDSASIYTCLLIYMLLLLAFQLFHQTGGKLRTETGRLYIATQRGEEKQRKRNRIYWTVASGFLLSKLSFVLSLLYIHVYSSLSSHLQMIWTDCMLCLGRDLDGHSSFEPHCWEVDDDVPLYHPPTTEIHPFKQQ